MSAVREKKAVKLNTHSLTHSHLHPRKNNNSKQMKIKNPTDRIRRIYGIHIK